MVDPARVHLEFAAHAAVVLAGAQNEEHLHTALTHRDIIGQAKGILMERYKISAQDAFRLLVVASQTTNIELHEVADYLTRTGQLNTPDPQPTGTSPINHRPDALHEVRHRGG